MYDKKAIKQFILSCHEQIDDNEKMESIEADDFFNLNTNVDNKPVDQMNVETGIFLSEIETLVEQVATDKAYCIFWLLAEGKTYKEIGRIFEVSGERVRQVFDKLLSKIEYYLNH